MDSKDRQELHGLVTAMPEGLVREVLAFTREILTKAKIDISYDWSEEDLEDVRRASADRVNRAFPWDDEVPDPDGVKPS
jgi:hypothetical protein